MDSILDIAKHVEFYIMFGAVLVMAGGVMTIVLYEFIREKASKGSVLISRATQEPTGFSVTIKS